MTNVTVKVPFDCAISIVDGDDNAESITVVELIDVLQKALESVPEQYRSVLSLSVSASGDYAHAYTTLQYARPKTDAERVAEQEKTVRYQREREASERREYARLRKKYEGEPTP